MASAYSSPASQASPSALEIAASGPKSLAKLSLPHPPEKSDGSRAPMNATCNAT
jgi:hypothetical protein